MTKASAPTIRPRSEAKRIGRRLISFMGSSLQAETSIHVEGSLLLWASEPAWATQYATQ